MSFFTTAIAIITSQLMQLSLEPQKAWEQEAVNPNFNVVDIHKQGDKYFVFGNEVFSTNNQSACAYLVGSKDLKYIRMGNSSRSTVADAAEGQNSIIAAGNSNNGAFWIQFFDNTGSARDLYTINGYKNFRLKKIAAFEQNILIAAESKNNELLLVVAGKYGEIIRDTVIGLTQQTTVQRIFVKGSKVVLVATGNKKSTVLEFDGYLTTIKTKELPGADYVFADKDNWYLIKQVQNKVEVATYDQAFVQKSKWSYTTEETIKDLSLYGQKLLITTGNGNTNKIVCINQGYLQWEKSTDVDYKRILVSGEGIFGYGEKDDMLHLDIYTTGNQIKNYKIFGGTLSDEPEAIASDKGRVLIASKSWKKSKSSPYLKLYALDKNLVQNKTFEMEIGNNEHIKSLKNLDGQFYLLLTEDLGNQQFRSKILVFDNKLNLVQTIKLKLSKEVEVNDFLPGQNGFTLTGTKYKDSKNSDIWIAYLDTKQKIKWEKTITGRRLNYGQKIIPTPLGAAILTENNYSKDNQKGDVGIITLDYKGNIKWRNTYGGIPLEKGNDIIYTQDMHYLISGVIQKPAGKDGLLMKIDGKGNLVWSKFLEGQGQDVYVGSCETKDYYLISGYTTSFGNGLDDMLVSYIDKTNGNTVENITIGGNLDERIKAMTVVNNRIFIAAYTRSYGSGSKDNAVLEL